MKLEDVINLVNAGYTKQEIVQMEQTGEPDSVPIVTPEPAPVAQPAPAPAPVAQPAPAPAPAPAPVAQPTPTPTPAPVQNDTQPTMNDLMLSVAKLTSAVQANAIAQSVIPNGATPTAPKAEDMIAEIIRPTFRERS